MCLNLRQAQGRCFGAYRTSFKPPPPRIAVPLTISRCYLRYFFFVLFSQLSIKCDFVMSFHPSSNDLIN